MKITKDILEKLEIKSMTAKIETYSSDIICVLTSKEKNEWTFSFSGDCHPETGDNIEIRVCFHTTDNYEKISRISGTIINTGTDYFTVTFDNLLSDNELSYIFRQINSYEESYQLFGRRSEERIAIGKKNYHNFGLKSPEQQLFLPGLNHTQPCAIIDASVHGICIITPLTSQFRNIENFYIKIDFEDTVKSVVLSVHKVNVRMNKIENDTFATISCQLLEPIHFEWKIRVIKLFQNLK